MNEKAKIIQMTNLKLVYQNNAVAEVDFYIPLWKLHLRKTRLCENSGNMFLNPPAYSVDQQDGTKQWVPYWEFTDEFKQRFMQVAREMAVEEYKKQRETVPDPLKAMTDFDDGLPF